ncbi:MAG: hypothetical protein V3S30_05085 [Thermoanaerobaculia bacterium]
MLSHRYVRTLVFLLIAVFTVVPGFAGLDVDLGAKVKLGDDVDIYLGVSSHYFGKDRTAINRLAARYKRPEDLAVALFIGKRSGRSADFIFSLRSSGLSWFEVSARVGLPVDIWFVEIDRDPGPPYGKAYGHWKKHRQNRSHAFVLSDADTRNLVSVRVIHEYYGVSVATAMAWTASGRGLTANLSAEYHRRHGKPTAKPGKGKGKEPTAAKAKGKGKHKKP